jgi:hypothetical protein
VPGFLKLTPGATSSSPMQIRFPVDIGHWYELQQSTDLISWSTISQTTGVSNVWVEFDAPASASKAVFYRVILH